MKRYYSKSFQRVAGLLSGGIVLAVTLSACGDDEAGISPDMISDPDHVMLVYAVASNNLSENLELDMAEMLAAADRYDSGKNVVVVYSVTPDGRCVLRRMTSLYGGSERKFVEIKEYPRLPLSVDKERIREVIDDVRTMFDGVSRRSLVLWSHGTGWTPFFGKLPAGDDSEGDSEDDSEDNAMRTGSGHKRSFGWDSYEGTHYECNITDLAEAIPDSFFEFIWFDCCYMSNIETLYQLRHKAEWIVAYPTEIYSPGLPYDQILPLLMSERPDLKGSAETLFKYYDSRSMAVTVAVTETRWLEDVATAAANLIDDNNLPGGSLQNYARSGYGPFYDFGQTLTSYPGATSGAKESFEDALDRAVVVKYASERDFNRVEIRPENYSGVSVHLFSDSDVSAQSDFYRTTDWYKATRGRF